MTARLTLRVLMLALTLALSGCLVVPHPAFAQPAAQRVDEFVNPLAVSVADPDVFKDNDGTYYLVGTTPANSSDGFEVYSSTDLVNWQRRAWCYRKTGSTWGQDNFWAPE